MVVTPRRLQPTYNRKETQDVVNKNYDALAEAQTNIASVTAKNSLQGTATITNPNTSQTVTHNYGSTSYVVSVEAQQDIGSGRRRWVDTKQANSFVIRVDAALGSDMTFEWILRGT